MLLIKLIIVSSLCLLSLTHRVQCEKTENSAVSAATAERNNKKDIKFTAAAQSTIYKIKRLNPSKDKQNLHKQRIEEQQQQHLQQLQQGQTSRQQDVMHHQEYKGNKKHTESGGVGGVDVTKLNKHRTKKFRKSGKNAHGLNRKLLNKLGFTKVKAPNSHNRKRLAIESRRHASPDDSHMFIIKLPPNMYYYTNPKPSTSGTATVSSSSSASSPNSIASSVDKKNSLVPHVLKDDTSSTKDANGKKVSFPFNSNGKPGRIYHWNLPVIKKMLEDKQRFPNVANIEPNKVEELIDIKNIPTWSKPWENDSIEKSYNQDSMMSYKKSLKRKSPTYYAPASAVNKNSFNKYFSGNGKPKGFYVIKENQKKPSYYKNIVA
ncbi:serum response factor homolog A [Lucilia sericata]|uniref:serum response factor homolog A n=1 Tax=Lucilia sericata TaxID=13632 RepID=UPI0018A87D8D|nr:serum response factor homolog A [Lucilia sericata]XP_037815013.1 serum response factor homolog A [Lucilia sericata]XP_037815019.1 serum response factor homolog A [Lucilia sericata]